MTDDDARRAVLGVTPVFEQARLIGEAAARQDDIVRWIREYHAAGEPDEKIAAEMGVTIGAVAAALGRAGDALLREPLIDPDCRDGKCRSCMGGPCEHGCHGYAMAGGGGVGASPPGAIEVKRGQLYEPPAELRHAHYYRQTTAGMVCSCGATVTT